jgi:uncharacterized protein (TIGR02145 family)
MRKYLFVILVAFLKVWMPSSSQNIATKSDTGAFTDARDNQSYMWLKIGTQVWMARNLNYAVLKGSSCYNYDTAFCQTYGRLYEWNLALKICPSGWHLPSHKEWTELSEFLGDQAGEKLKEPDDKHWKGPDAVVRGDSGFNALPAGYKGVDERDRPFYAGLSNSAFFWSASTATPATKGWARYLDYLDDELHQLKDWKVFGFSVRCIKNEKSL